MTRERWLELKSEFKMLGPPWRTFIILLFDTFILACSLFLKSTEQSFDRVVSIFLLGLVLLHAYLFLHEATHSAISKRKWLNNWVGHVCGWMIGMPFLPRQRSHLLHHVWTGHPVGDPANRRIIQRFSVMTAKEATRLDRIWKSWIPVITLNDRIGMWKDPFIQISRGSKSARHFEEIQSICMYLLSYSILFGVLFFFGSLGGFLKWYVPAAVLQLILEELTNLPHHAETPLLKENEKALPYWEQDKVTHSCEPLPIWSNFILLNFNLHTAHHLFPWVSWGHLPRVHRALLKECPELKKKMRNELSWSIRNRKNSLVDLMGHYINKAPRITSVSQQNQSGISLEVSIDA